MKRQYWNAIEIDKLRKNVDKPVNTLAKMFPNRTFKAVESKLAKIQRDMGIQPKHVDFKNIQQSQQWSEQEMNILKKHYFEDIENLMEILPGRTWNAIKKKKISLKKANMKHGNVYGEQKISENTILDSHKVTVNPEIQEGLIESTKPMTESELIQALNVETDKWDSYSWSVEARDIITFRGEHRKNYTSRLSFRRKTGGIDFDLVRAEILDIMKQEKTIKFANYKPYKFNRKDNLLVINIADLHLGKLCWEGEVLVNWDHKIACDIVLNSLKDLMAKAVLVGFDRIMLSFGNDYFHFNDNQQTTKKGTPLSVDNRWPKIYVAGQELIMTIIDYLLQFAPVDIVSVISNHDETLTTTLALNLKSLYKDNPNVTVDKEYPTSVTRKYYKYYNNVIGLTHGSEEKESDLAKIMPVELKSKMDEDGKSWWHCEHTEFHIAHVHHQKKFESKTLEDDKGVIIRYMQAVCPEDDWTFRKGYVGSKKGIQGYLYNRQDGFIFQINSNITYKPEYS